MKFSPFASLVRRSKPAQPATSARASAHTTKKPARSGHVTSAQWDAGAKAVVASLKTTSPYRHLDDDAETQQAKQLADQIIDAGKKARGEEFDPPPKPGSTAAAILAAGRVRRGEVT